MFRWKFEEKEIFVNGQKVSFFEKENTGFKMMINRMREWAKVNLPMISMIFNTETEKERKRFVHEDIYDYIQEKQECYVEDLLKYLEERGCPQTEEAVRRFLDWQVHENYMIKPSENFYRVRE